MVLLTIVTMGTNLSTEIVAEDDLVAVFSTKDNQFVYGTNIGLHKLVIDQPLRYQHANPFHNSNRCQAMPLKRM
jgi:hypothetical protein